MAISDGVLANAANLNAAFADKSAEGAGGGSLQWIEAALSPLPSIENNIQVYEFQDDDTQYLYACVKVPASLTSPQQVKLKLNFYSSATSGTILIKTLSTLIRVGVDAISSTTNQYASTNAAVTLSGGTANIPQSVILDLTNASGEINSVAYSANDYILIRLTRDTTSDTSTGSAKIPVYGAEVTFNG